MLCRQRDVSALTSFNGAKGTGVWLGCLRWEVTGSLLLSGRLKFSSAKNIVIREEAVWRWWSEKVFAYRDILCNQMREHSCMDHLLSIEICF